jgi:type II secretory pathway component GspD/PulD (secretin)
MMPSAHQKQILWRWITGAARLRAVLALIAFVATLTYAADACAQRKLKFAFDDIAKTSAESEPAADEVSQPTANDPSDVVAEQNLSEELLPAPRLQGRLPLADGGAGDVQMSERNGLITLVVRDAALSRVLALLAQEKQLNIVAANDIDALISITLRDVPLEEALTAILSVANYTWVKRNNIILITSLTGASNLAANVQGRQIQIFDLDFAKASIVAESVTNFLSPIGKVTVTQSDPADNRMTQERIVVEDMPESLARIAAFICQIDRPPRQVLIEAHVLQVNLDDTCRCGVNFDELLRISGSDLSFATKGFANPNAPQAFLATLEGGDLGGVIEALQTTTDTKTLGSPKLLVLNEQEARIQVGEQLGFKVTTTTETSTMETVQFLDVGVILSIIPRITRDGRVLLHVKPEVSKGEVNPETGLPEEESTQLETDVMLEDGEGMIIGGLIKESDSVVQSKIPYLGTTKGIGWLFRKSEVTKNRAEIIVALVPRIQPYDSEWQAYEQGELARAGMPLFHGPLQRVARPEPILPDGKRLSHPLIPRKGYRMPGKGYYHLGEEYDIPPKPLPRQTFYGDECEVCEEDPQPTSRRHPNPFVREDVVPMPEELPLEEGEVITDQR